MTATVAAPHIDTGLSMISLVSVLRPMRPVDSPSRGDAAAEGLEQGAWTALEDGRSGDGIELLRQWHELDPTNAVPRIRIAVALAIADRWSEAEECVRAVLARHPDRGDGWSVLGFLLAAEGGRFADALVALNEALALTPHDHLARIIRAMLRAGAGDLDPAMADCAEIPADSDHFASSRRVWAAALGRLGRYAEGLRKLHELDETTLEGPEAATLRSWLLDEFFAERRDPHWGPRLPGKPQGLNPPIKLRGDGPLVSQMILDDRE